MDYEILKKIKRDYSSTQFNLNGDIRSRVIGMSRGVSDGDLSDKGREAEPHITIKYGIDVDEAEAIRVIRDFAGNMPPVAVRLGVTSVFTVTSDVQRGGQEFDVVKIDVDSQGLRILNATISSLLKCVDSHSVYRPHITLAYVKPRRGEAYAGWNDVLGETILFDKIIFSGASGKKVSIPLLGSDGSRVDSRDDGHGGSKKKIVFFENKRLVSIQELRDRMKARLAGERLAKANPNHDDHGRFAIGSGGSANSPTKASPVVQSWASKKFKNPEHAKAFVEWFGDSKAVNKNGEPLVVYHGTATDIKDFSSTRIGEFGPAVYTTSDPDEANTYAKSAKGDAGANILPLYLSLRNPFVGDAESYYKKFGTDNTKDSDENTKQAAIRAGYDGIISKREEIDWSSGKPVKTGKTMTHYIAFFPHQIKSATGNAGTYSPLTTNINKANPNHDEHGRFASGSYASASKNSHAAVWLSEKFPDPSHAEAFKKWFGDFESNPSEASKVVDGKGVPQETHSIPSTGSKVMRDGVPVVVYHGTAKGGFEEFDKSKANKDSLYGPGFYFTEDHEVATEYSETKDTPKAEIIGDKKATADEFRKRINAALAEAKKKVNAIVIENAPEYRRMDDLANHYSDEGLLDAMKFDAATGTAVWWEKQGVKISDLIRTSKEVKSVFLNIRNPVDVEKPLSVEDANRIATAIEKLYKWTRNVPIEEALVRRANSGRHTVQSALEDISNDVATSTKMMTISNGMGGTREVESMTVMNKRDWPGIFAAAGYDGITHTGGYGMGSKLHRVWIAFEPTQIKSTDNHGSFDPNDPNIRKSLKDRVREAVLRKMNPNHDGKGRFATGSSSHGSSVSSVVSEWASKTFKDSVRAEAFKKWFGDSKIVNESGNPAIVFHGTRNFGFESFSSEHLGSNTKAASAMEGFFFSGSRDTAESKAYVDQTKEVNTEGSAAIKVASEYSKSTWDRIRDVAMSNESVESDVKRLIRDGFIDKEGNLTDLIHDSNFDDASDMTHAHVECASAIDWISYQLHSENLDDKYVEFDEDAKQSLKYGRGTDDVIDESMGSGVYEVFLSVKNPMVVDQKGERYRDTSYYELIKNAKSKGHDGLVIKNTYDGGPKDDIFVVFDSTQIKSVDSNFDSSSTNIYKMNPNHDGKGRFATGSGSSSVKLAVDAPPQQEPRTVTGIIAYDDPTISDEERKKKLAYWNYGIRELSRETGIDELTLADRIIRSGSKTHEEQMAYMGKISDEHKEWKAKVNEINAAIRNDSKALQDFRDAMKTDTSATHRQRMEFAEKFLDDFKAKQANDNYRIHLKQKKTDEWNELAHRVRTATGINELDIAQEIIDAKIDGHDAQMAWMQNRIDTHDSNAPHPWEKDDSTWYDPSKIESYEGEPPENLAKRTAHIEAAWELRKHFRNALSGASISDDKRVAYLANIQRVLNWMETPALLSMQENLRKTLFYANTRRLTDSVISEHERASVGPGYNIGGAWSHNRDDNRGDLHLDGGSDIGGNSSTMTAASIYAHEFGHAVDWIPPKEEVTPNGTYHSRGKHISNTMAWMKAYSEELANKQLSDYASTSLAEGFAEFARYCWGEGNRPKEVAAAFPKCYEVFKSHGYVK